MRREHVLGSDLFLPSSQKVSGPVVVLDAAKGMFVGLLAQLLFWNVAPDEHHDAPLVVLEFAEVVVGTAVLFIV